MKNITIISAAVLLFVSCGQTRERIQKSAEDLKEKVSGNPNDDKVQAPKPEQLKLTYSHAFVNRHSPFIIIPTRLKNLSGKGDDIPLYSNLIFFNPEDGQVNHLDTNYAGFIEQFSVLTSQPPKAAQTEDDEPEEMEVRNETEYQYTGKNTPGSLIFMEIANSKLETDERSTVWESLYKGRNGSGTGYNKYLAIVNHDGKNFTALTPDNSAVIWWQFIREGAGFLASAVVDSDNNGKIEDSDKVELFYTNLLKPEQGHTVIPAALQQTLTNDYIKRKTAFEQKSVSPGD